MNTPTFLFATGLSGLSVGYLPNTQSQPKVNWQQIIDRGFDFGNTFLQNKYAKDAAKYSPTGLNIPSNYQIPAGQYQLNPGGAPPPGVGFGLDGTGIRLSDGSHIGWTTIALAAGAFFLLQSRPVTRAR